MSDPTAIDLAPVNPGSDPFKVHVEGWTRHGNHRIDCPFITKVAKNLYQGGVETGLVLPRNIKFVLSLYKWESYIYDSFEAIYEKVEMLDSVNQDLDEIDSLALMVNSWRETGQDVLVHCQAGLNRSSLVVGRALMLNGDVDSGQQAIDLMRAQRSPAVLCNPAFEKWLKDSDTPPRGSSRS